MGAPLGCHFALGESGESAAPSENGARPWPGIGTRHIFHVAGPGLEETSDLDARVGNAKNGVIEPVYEFRCTRDNYPRTPPC
jgi:hypothetical protein